MSERGAGDDLGIATDANVADLVAGSARRDPSRCAVIEIGGSGPVSRLTWRELDDAATAEAHRLRAAGVATGDRVALCVPSGTAFCVAFFGALRAGGVAAPLA